MIVVSNASPITNLNVVGRQDLLHQLYHQVYIPEAVFRELSAMDSHRLEAIAVQTIGWIEAKPVDNRSLVESLLLELDLGEAEAIILASETKADLLLLDERRGRKVASRFNIRCIGLLGILIDAKRKGLLDAVKPILDDMIAKAGFWVGSRLYARVLQDAGE